MIETQNFPLTKPNLINILYQIKKEVENWSIIKFKNFSQNTYFESNLKTL